MGKSKWGVREYKRHSRWPSAVSLIMALTIILAGLTFAALQSQPVKLTGNTISTATTGLVLSLDGNNFASSLPGFNFGGLIPGGPATPDSGYAFYIRDTGDIPLVLKLSVAGTPSNPAGVDLNKVNVILMAPGGAQQSFTLQSLISANATGGLPITTPSQVFPGNTSMLSVKVSLAADALNGPSASIGNIDFALTGLAQ